MYLVQNKQTKRLLIYFTCETLEGWETQIYFFCPVNIQSNSPEVGALGGQYAKKQDKPKRLTF